MASCNAPILKVFRPTPASPGAERGPRDSVDLGCAVQVAGTVVHLLRQVSSSDGTVVHWRGFGAPAVAGDTRPTGHRASLFWDGGAASSVQEGFMYDRDSHFVPNRSWRLRRRRAPSCGAIRGVSIQENSPGNDGYSAERTKPSQSLEAVQVHPVDLFLSLVLAIVTVGVQLEEPVSDQPVQVTPGS